MDAQTQRQINAQLLRKTILAPFSLEAKFFSPERAHRRGDAIFWSVGREAKTKGYLHILPSDSNEQRRQALSSGYCCYKECTVSWQTRARKISFLKILLGE
jgi:hypothetical protein